MLSVQVPSFQSIRTMCSLNLHLQQSHNCNQITFTTGKCYFSHLSLTSSYRLRTAPSRLVILETARSSDFVSRLLLLLSSCFPNTNSLVIGGMSGITRLSAFCSDRWYPATATFNTSFCLGKSFIFSSNCACRTLSCAPYLACVKRGGGLFRLLS